MSTRITSRGGVREDQRRRDAVDKTSSVLTGVYDADYLDELREDWPA